MSKKKNPLAIGALGLTKGSLALGIGAAAVGGLPQSNITVHASRGFTTASRYLPMTGTVMGGGMLVKRLKRL